MRKCPFCKSEVFVKTTIEQVIILDSGENLYDEVIKTDSCSFSCRQCKRKVTEEELV